MFSNHIMNQTSKGQHQDKKDANANADKRRLYNNQNRDSDPRDRTIRSLKIDLANLESTIQGYEDRIAYLKRKLDGKTNYIGKLLSRLRDSNKSSPQQEEIVEEDETIEEKSELDCA